MSVEALSWVLNNSAATLGDRLVLISLANHAHSDGSKAFPAVATLADQAKLSERQVQYSLRELERMGEITCTGRTSKGVNIYNVGGADSAPDSLSGRLKDGSGEVDCTPGAQSSAPLGADSAPLTVNFCEPCTIRFSSKRKYDEHRYNVHHEGWPG